MIRSRLLIDSVKTRYLTSLIPVRGTAILGCRSMSICCVPVAITLHWHAGNALDHFNSHRHGFAPTDTERGDAALAASLA